MHKQDEPSFLFTKIGVLRTLNFGFTKPYPKLIYLALSSSYFAGNNRYKILTITAALSGMFVLTSSCLSEGKHGNSYKEANYDT